MGSNLFKLNGEITFQGGEPTLLGEIDDLLKLFADNKIFVRVHSSGIRFNQNLKESIQKELASVIVSIDSGTPKIYKKIKQIDCFEKVYKNLKKYVENQDESSKKLVKAKYIIVPGYNDSIFEINSFLKKMKKIGITSIIVDIECYAFVSFGGSTPENMQVLMDYFKFKTKKNKMELEYYDSAHYFEDKRKKNTRLYPFSIMYLIKYLLTKKDFEKYRINYQK